MAGASAPQPLPLIESLPALPVEPEAPGQARAGFRPEWPFSPGGARQPNLQADSGRHWWGAMVGHQTGPSWLSGSCNASPPQWVGFPVACWFAARIEASRLRLLSNQLKRYADVLIKLLLLLFSAPFWLWRPWLIKLGWGPIPLSPKWPAAASLGQPFNVDQTAHEISDAEVCPGRLVAAQRSAHQSQRWAAGCERNRPR